MERRSFIALTATALAGCSTRADTQDTETPAISNDSLDVKLTLGKELYPDEPTWIAEGLHELFHFVDVEVTFDGPALYNGDFQTPEEASSWWLDRADDSYHADVLLIDLDLPNVDGYSEHGETAAIAEYREVRCTPRVVAHEIVHSLGYGHVEGDTVMSADGACSASSNWKAETKQYVKDAI